MEESTSREKILKRIRKALPNIELNPLAKEVDRETPLFKPITQPLTVHFAEIFVKKGGRFVYCKDEDDLTNQLNELIAYTGWKSLFVSNPKLWPFLKPSGLELMESHEEGIPVVSGCEKLIARSGELLLSSNLGLNGNAGSVKEVIFIAFADQLVPDLKQGLSELKSSYDNNLPPELKMHHATGSGLQSSVTYLFFVDKKLTEIEVGEES